MRWTRPAFRTEQTTPSLRRWTVGIHPRVSQDGRHRRAAVRRPPPSGSRRPEGRRTPRPTCHMGNGTEVATNTSGHSCLATGTSSLARSGRAGGLKLPVTKGSTMAQVNGRREAAASSSTAPSAPARFAHHGFS